MNNLCLCGSDKNYHDCCDLYITKQQYPTTPEALMRSRYTAYTLGNIDYIVDTMKGAASKNFDANSAKDWATSNHWLGLTLIRAWNDTDGHGFVEFIAHFESNGSCQCLYEISEFEHDNGRWYYVDGESPQVSKNQQCPCNSGKKAKRCCFS